MIDRIIFDLDGTLVDSASDIVHCVRESYRRVTGIDVEVPRTALGPPLVEIARRLTPMIDDSSLDALLRAFRELYDSSPLSGTVLYEGIAGMMNRLVARRARIFVATNKPAGATFRILEKLSLTGFSGVVTPDLLNGADRGKRQMIDHLISEEGAKPSRFAMVGDTESDIAAAKACGIVSVGVLYGYGDEATMVSSCPDYLARTVDELGVLLEKALVMGRV